MPMLATERDSRTGYMRRFTYQDQQPLSITSTAENATYQYWTDRLGSVTALTTSDGSLAAAYEYNSWGAPTIERFISSVPTNPLQYTGQYLDSETGDYHLRARQYNPNLGRFTSRDPLPADPGASYTSTYAYANNQPTLLTDPTGQRGQEIKGNKRTLGCTIQTNTDQNLIYTADGAAIASYGNTNTTCLDTGKQKPNGGPSISGTSLKDFLGLSGTLCKWRDLKIHDFVLWVGKDRVDDDTTKQ